MERLVVALIEFGMINNNKKWTVIFFEQAIALEESDDLYFL